MFFISRLKVKIVAFFSISHDLFKRNFFVGCGNTNSKTMDFYEDATDKNLPPSWKLLSEDKDYIIGVVENINDLISFRSSSYVARWVFSL